MSIEHYYDGEVNVVVMRVAYTGDKECRQDKFGDQSMDKDNIYIILGG
jgi:hypothetical protein